MALIYNGDLPDDLSLSRDAVVGIFNGTVTYWDDPIITSANPKLVFPHNAIIPVVRNGSAGRYD